MIIHLHILASEAWDCPSSFPDMCCSRTASYCKCSSCRQMPPSKVPIEPSWTGQSGFLCRSWRHVVWVCPGVSVEAVHLQQWKRCSGATVFRTCLSSSDSCWKRCLRGEPLFKVSESLSCEIPALFIRNCPQNNALELVALIKQIEYWAGSCEAWLS